VNKKLKIAVLVDSDMITPYQSAILDDIVGSDFSVLSLCVKAKKISNDMSKAAHLLYYSYMKLDCKIFGKNLKMFQSELLSNKFDTIVNFPSFIDENMLDDIKEYNLDVIIDLREVFSTTKLNNIATFGLWRLNHRGFPNAFWEVADNHNITKVTLEKISSSFEGGYLLDTFAITTDAKSPHKNLNMIRWRSHTLVIKNLKKLHIEGKSFFLDKKCKSTFDNSKLEINDKKINLKLDFYEDVKKHIPTNYDMIKIFSNIFRKSTKMLFRKYMIKQQWKLFYIENDKELINFSFDKYKELSSKSINVDWADPFVVDEKDKSYIFFEEFALNQKGTLHVITYDVKTKIFSEPEEVMSKDYHLSYPFVFSYADEYYMIPESNGNKTIDLYKTTNFPTQWEKVKTLIDDIVAVDSTIHYKDDIWWMFTNIAPKDGFSTSDELYIYYCQDLLNDEWIAHKQNPVICDSSVARNAGKIIEKNNILYRPSQNCSGYYGRALNINKIEILNENSYKECTIDTIDLQGFRDIQAVHTLNSSKRFTIIDIGFIKI